jgi:NADH-quinone oxidoreductase subunit M
MGFHILFIIMLAPIIGALAILFVPEKKDKTIKTIAAVASAAALILSFIAFINYNGQIGGMQFAESYTWIPGFGADFSLGVDGLSMPMVLLTSIYSSAEYLFPGRWKTGLRNSSSICLCL